MRPQRTEVFRSDAASRLDDIELIIALLERDATNGRAFSVERGLDLPPTKRRRALRLANRAVSGIKSRITTEVDAARRGKARAGRLVLHPRVFAAAGAAGRFITDLAVVLMVAGGALAAVVAAFLVAAPPG